ncbi:MAG: methyltransferase, CheR-type [Firmicutes bacterium]|nr:methyltransferase, CheR-type [Bacillota bacterium]
MTKVELEELKLFINQRYGLEFRHQQLELLQEAVEKRIKVCAFSTVSEYLYLLQQREEESLQLIHLLTVNETYFFREPIHFDVMAMQVIPELVRKGQKRPFLRVVSAGCSTGEEAYSMAIAILKIPGAGIDWDFEVIGVDVDKEAIQKAQVGLYGLYSFRSCPKDIQDRYFERMSKESFTIKNFVKEKVRFECLNLFEQVYPDWIRTTDIIFYRNVSIYFSKEQRKEAFRRLANLLNHGGCLFLSCTEMLYHNNNVLPLVKSGETFYYRKQNNPSILSQDTVAGAITGIDKHTVQRNHLVPPQIKRRTTKAESRSLHYGLSSHTPEPPMNNKGDRCQEIFAEALQLVNFKKYDEAIVRLDEIIAHHSFFVKAYALKANILLNQQNVAAAIEVCYEALAVDHFCLEAYLLLGMAAKFAGQMEEAIQRFKEAIYVHPECWLAHFFLAEVYQLQKEISYAGREYEVAMRILKQGNFENHGLSFFLVPFQLEDFIQLCQYNIANLKD